MATTEKPKGGLEDVVATSSRICFLDGDRGVLAYCGHDIHDLARQATFEETCYLLWHGRLPNRAELGDLQSQLAAGRSIRIRRWVTPRTSCTCCSGGVQIRRKCARWTSP